VEVETQRVGRIEQESSCSSQAQCGTSEFRGLGPGLERQCPGDPGDSG
jgi:hypothetical protein